VRTRYAPVTMTLGRLGKASLVVGGYVAAALVAVGVVALYVVATDGPDRQASQGMYAFGDLSLFLMVFAAGALLPTAAALYFLRRSTPFWLSLAALSVAVALTGVPGLLGLLSVRGGHDASGWIALSFLRLMGAPLLLPMHGLAALLAPGPRLRRVFLGASGLELLCCLALAGHLALAR